MLDINTLNEICALIHNRFDDGARFSGDFVIRNGDIADLPEELKAGTYVWIDNSSMNDGAYCIGSGGLVDESFRGRIAIMKLPADFRNLVLEIADWKKVNAKVLTSIYQSESFGGYSYTLDTAGGRATLAGVFGSRLNKYRKV